MFLNYQYISKILGYCLQACKGFITQSTTIATSLNQGKTRVDLAPLLLIPLCDEHLFITNQLNVNGV